MSQNIDSSSVWLVAVAGHLNRYVHELKHTFGSARTGTDGVELHVWGRYHSTYSSDTAALAAWAKTMTEVTVEAGIRGEAVHLVLKGKFPDNTPAEIRTVESAIDARCWLDQLNADDGSDVPVTLDLLDEIAAQMDKAAGVRLDGES